MMSPSRSFALFACLVAATVVGCGPRRVSSPVADAAAAVTIREGLASTTAAAVGGGEAAATGTGWAGLKGRFTDHEGVLFGAGGLQWGDSYDQHHGWALWALAAHYLHTGNRD